MNVSEDMLRLLLSKKSRQNSQSYHDNAKWLGKNFEKQRKENPDKIVIVLDGAIWDVAKNPYEVYQKLAELPRGKQLQAYIEHIPGKGKTLLY